MMNRNVVAAIAGGAGLCFLGYCVYFDRKRRSDPEFKIKLREKRQRQREVKASQDAQKYPDLTDETAVQKFFMAEIQLGEQLMALGDIEAGVEHLANAVAVTSQKDHLLNLLRTTLPEQIFQLIVQKLPEVSEKIFKSAKLKYSQDSNEPRIVDITEATLAVDDCLD